MDTLKALWDKLLDQYKKVLYLKADANTKEKIEETGQKPEINNPAVINKAFDGTLDNSLAESLGAFVRQYWFVFVGGLLALFLLNRK